MVIYDKYDSPLGRILVGADELGLASLCFEDTPEETVPVETGAERPVSRTEQEAAEEILARTKEWLRRYFAGEEPGELPPVHVNGSAFQQEVWGEIARIPYGATVTYGDIARRIAARRGIPRMAAQAVGGAVGSNPVSLVVPCHRVVGKDGALVGYGGGLDRKKALLELEKEASEKLSSREAEGMT